GAGPAPRAAGAAEPPAAAGRLRRAADPRTVLTGRGENMSAPTLPVAGAVLGPDNGDALYEIVNGQRQEIPPMGAFAGEVASELAGHLWAFARQHQLGRVYVEVL